MIVTTPERAPMACGRNVTLIVQLAPDASVLPQLVLMVKSPLTVMLPIDSGPLPALNTTTFCGTVGLPTLPPPKLRYPLLSKGLAAVPVPRRLIDWVPPNPSSYSVRAAARTPYPCGVKLTVREQEAPGAIARRQLLDWV